MLSTPPAFILSQDQTLNKNFVFVFAVFVECTCKHARSPHYARKLILIQFKINILANLSLLLFYKVSSLNIKTFLESFKVVSLFNYQGSLLLFSSAATFIISLLFKFFNNFFIYFSIFRLKLCLSYCLSQTASLYYHPLRFLSTAFFIFLQN